jgi:hypothetical protein
MVFAVLRGSSPQRKETALKGVAPAYQKAPAVVVRPAVKVATCDHTG